MREEKEKRDDRTVHKGRMSYEAVRLIVLGMQRPGKLSLGRKIK
jgi:hypothetical protein